MTRNELMAVLELRLNGRLPAVQVEAGVKAMLAQMTETLAAGERIEIRGFGSFSIRHRPVGVGRNPKTGETIHLPARTVPHFKPGKALRERVNTLVDRQQAA